MINLKEIDKTIELWNSIPNNPPVWDEEEVDWPGDDWAVSYHCTCPDLWTGLKKTLGKPIVCPEIHCSVGVYKNEKC